MTTKDTIMALHDEACEAHHCNGSHLYNQVTAEKRQKLEAAVEAALAPQQVPEPLTARELELIDGMIGVQLEHAMRCDQIANRRMAEKQKGWDMERVALLQKIKAASPQPAPQPAKWVGLRGEECVDIARQLAPRTVDGLREHIPNWIVKYAKAIETKLREKNGGAA